MRTAHRANIFSAQFLPETSDHQIISCAGDGAILHTDILRQEKTLNSFFNCHGGTVYEVAIVPGDPNSFLTCGEDGTVRWFDLRTKSKCAEEDCRDDILIRCQRAVTSLSLHPVVNYQLALGCSDSFVRVYDRRMLRSGDEGEVNGTTGLLTKFSPPGIGEAPRRITCVSYRPDGEELLASYSSDYIYVFDPRDSTEDSGTKLKLGRPGEKCDSPQPVKKLRLRGDWSDTGPNSRPEMLSDRVPPSERESGEDRGLHSTLMQRMTDALSRMLNDPGTRMAMQRLHRGEGSEGEEEEEGEGNRRLEGERERVGRREGEQGRAASAIQERWRNYRRRRREEEATRQEGESERPLPVAEEVDVERDDEVREARRSEVVVEEAAEEVDRCSPLSICCPRFTRNINAIGLSNDKLQISGQIGLNLSLRRRKAPVQLMPKQTKRKKREMKKGLLHPVRRMGVPMKTISWAMSALKKTIVCWSQVKKIQQMVQVVQLLRKVRGTGKKVMLRMLRT